VQRTTSKLASDPECLRVANDLHAGAAGDVEADSAREVTRVGAVLGTDVEGAEAARMGGDESIERHSRQLA